MQVIIIGPNLRDQSKGQLHVHKAGCKDLARFKRHEPEYDYAMGIPPVEAQTRAEIVLNWYPPEEFEYNPHDESDYLQYRDEFYFFPCTKDLPE